MTRIIINPGTEADAAATLANAEAIANFILDDMAYANSTMTRCPERDRNGYFGFRLDGVDLDIPGDDPDLFFESIPFRSRRMYVDGSSWLWKYASGMIAELLTRKKET